MVLQMLLSSYFVVHLQKIFDGEETCMIIYHVVIDTYVLLFTM